MAANTHSFDPAASWPPPASLDFENENAVADWAYAASLADASRRTEITAQDSFRVRVRRGAAIQSALQSSINDAIHEINKACAATAANASNSNNNNTAIPDDHGDGQVFNTYISPHVNTTELGKGEPSSFLSLAVPISFSPNNANSSPTVPRRMVKRAVLMLVLHLLIFPN